MQRPNTFEGILGHSFVARGARPVLQIGSRSWSLYDLARLGIPHPRAARHLDAVRQQLAITSLPQLRDATDAICRLAGTGPTTLYVVLALLAEAGIKPATAYHATVTLPGLKRREAVKSTDPTRRRRTSRGTRA
jgi:hypothetical protein